MANSTSIRPFIEEAEGRLSRAKTDTASAHPAPWPYKDPKSGITYSDWHTNTGITYSSFVSMAPVLGYAITADNFFNMPDYIWGGIFKKGYWDQLELDNVKSQAIADTILTWAWGSGTTGAYIQLQKYLAGKGIKVSSKKEVDDAFNSLVNITNEKEIFLELADKREAFFKSLNQPANLKGWLSRLDKFRQYGLNVILKKKIKVVAIGLIIIVIIIAGISYAYNSSKK
jgi:lysozyme family protein